MDSSNFVLDTSLGFNLNLSLSDPTSLGSDSRDPSDNPIFNLEARKEEKPNYGELLSEELNKMSTENKKLTQMLTEMCENYSNLQTQLMGFINRSPKPETDHPNQKKRKAFSEGFELDYESKRDMEQSYIAYVESCKRARQLNTKPKVYKTLVRAENSNPTLVVKDGYQWRKYGQKVTRDNPSPRAYFKCANAPICHVKKKVQRSVDDTSILVATYEGEHNHAKPNSRDNMIDQVVLGSSFNTKSPSGIPTITLDWINHNNLSPNINAVINEQNMQINVDTKTLQRLFAEQMASSLSRDPSFTSSLAAAISGKISNVNYSC